MKIVRSQIIILLIALSVFVTGGTFAYWATAVEGTSDTATNTLKVGTGNSVVTSLLISPEQENYGTLVPIGQKDNSINPLAVEEMYVLHDLSWYESQEVLQTEGNDITGNVDVSFTLEIYPDQEDQMLNSGDFNNVYSLIHIEEVEGNTNELLLNDSSSKEVMYKIYMDEPANQEEYLLIAKSTIKVNFHYVVNTEYISDTTSLQIDFTKIDMNEVTSWGVESDNISRYTTEIGTPLTQDVHGGESILFIPIDKDEYTLTVVAQLTEPDSTSGGYGIFYDITLDENNNDNGYIFQFDRGYSRGTMVNRPRFFGYEESPNWTYSSDGETFPSKYDDPEWWTDVHEITIDVKNLDQNTRIATFFIDGVSLGSVTYEDVIDDEQVYVGFRGWSGSPTMVYSLELK